jgi:type I restriction enzyme S subunit
VNSVLTGRLGPCIPFSRAVERRKRTGAPELQPLSVYLEAGVVPRSTREDNHNRLGFDLSAYLIVEPGDIVFNKLRTWQGGLGVSRYKGIVSPAYFVCRPSTDYEPRFLHYLLRSAHYLAEFARISKFMPPSQFDILWEDLRLVPIPTRPVDEQRAIADFLDTETARIDALITKKHRLIDLLEERFRGEVEVRTAEGKPARVRFTTSLVTSGPRGWSDYVADTGDPFVRSANLRRSSIGLRVDDLVSVMPPAASRVEATRSRLATGDVLVGITGANTGWVGIAGPEVVGGYVSQHVALLRPIDIAPEWLGYSIFSHRSQGLLLGSQYGGTKQQLGLAELAELPIRLPSVETQRYHLAVLEALRERTERTEALLASQIALLQEHRQALITAAVTGELDVPGVAA